MATGRTFPTIVRDICHQLKGLQRPSEFFLLFAYNISTLSAIRICNEAGIFRRLATSSQPLTAKQLAVDIPNTPAAQDEKGTLQREEYITRMLRGVSGLQLIDEVGPYTYIANDLTRTFAEPGFEAGWAEAFDNACGPHSTLTHMVTWARDHHYTAPTTATDGPYQQARDIVGTSTFDHWAQSDPGMFTNLSLWMQRIQQDRLNWSEWFPTDALFGESGTESSEDSIFMVDVGGGYGHDLAGMAARYPNRKIRLVNQDLPNVISEAKEQKLDHRIEHSEHDFFKPQPIKGAKIASFHALTDRNWANVNYSISSTRSYTTGLILSVVRS